LDTPTNVLMFYALCGAVPGALAGAAGAWLAARAQAREDAEALLAERKRAEQLEAARDEVHARLVIVQRHLQKREADLAAAASRAEDGALAEARQRCQELADRLEDAYQVMESMRVRLARAERRRDDTRSIPAIAVHSVYLDGQSDSGKTTLVRRLTDATASPAQLEQLVASELPERSPPFPVGFEQGPAGRTLHALSFYDTVGEKPETWLEGVLEHGQHGAQPTAVALLVWDLTKPAEANLEYLSLSRIRLAYGMQQVRDAIPHVVILFNKQDVAGASDEELARLQTILRRDRFERLTRPPTLSFCVGSAVTGEGMHHCLGRLITALDLAEPLQDGMRTRPRTA
jgi:gas vesicle protein/signal recognition particle receptor subunit beta